MGAQEQPNLDMLIAVEWDTLQGLKKALQDPDLSPTERAQLSNAVAYHMSVLNKMFSQRGEKAQFSDATLGDFIRKVDVKSFRTIRREFKLWTKRLSSEKSRQT
jgi:hypothetical protein